VDLDPVVADRVDRELAQHRIVDLGRREVGDDRAVVEGVDPAARAVHELVADHEVAGLDVELERARGARRDDGFDPERAHRPDVGPVVDPVRRDRVSPPVAGQEGHPPTGHLGEEERVGRRTVRGVHLDLAYIVEERVEAGAAEHADLRCIRAGHAFLRAGPSGLGPQRAGHPPGF